MDEFKAKNRMAKVRLPAWLSLSIVCRADARLMHG